LWLDENRDQLTESQPEGENDFSKYAAEQFRALAKEERQVISCDMNYIPCVSCVDPDQAAHVCSQIRIYTGCI
jgi:hypothetical protein